MKFHKCMKTKLAKKRYSGKKAWQKEFKKAVKFCACKKIGRVI
jgi:hypothetical protein